MADGLAPRNKLLLGERGLLTDLARCNRQIQSLEAHFFETNRYGKLLKELDGQCGTTTVADRTVSGIKTEAPPAGASGDSEVRKGDLTIFTDASCTWWGSLAKLES